jgi:hypothetical protein
MVVEVLGKNSQKGFITLYSVIILGSIGVALVAVLAMSSIFSIQNSGDDFNSAQARKAVDSCVEVALQVMSANNSFTGSGNSSIGGATCTYLVTNTGGNNRTINATGTLGSLIRKVTVSTNAFSPKINISNWLEIP